MSEGARRYDAFLFDMDGTIINSIPSAVRVWSEWAMRHGVDRDELFRVMHGVRAIETIRRFAPHADADAEFDWLLQAEMDDVADVVAIPGAIDCAAEATPRGWRSGYRKLPGKITPSCAPIVRCSPCASHPRVAMTRQLSNCR